MKVTVLAPSAEYATYAGARIRYGRLAPPLAELGIDLTLVDIAGFVAHEDTSDVILISKCFDARALVAAAVFAQRGRLVGVDLFDDYFSQAGDSRLSRYRNWLAQLLPSCNFALVATPKMGEVVAGYRSDVPVHVVNDPGPIVDIGELAGLLSRKLATARDEQCLRVAWFGVGDNPNFQVGLDDVAAFGAAVRELSRTGLDVELHLLTNKRALTANGLAQLARLPVRTVVEEWSEEREKAVLDAAFAAFLPVNTQAFSKAKSLNRAVTALSAGCQVLSVGHPLYAALEPLIYRDAATLARDAAAGSPRHSPANTELFAELMAAFGSAENEAAKLAQFLSHLDPGDNSDAPVVLVHGFATNGIAHKMVQAAGGLSVASPACTTELGFDAIFREGLDSLSMLVSAKAARRLRSGLEPRLELAGTVGARKFFELRVTTGSRRDPPVAREERLALQLATYPYAMDEIRRRIEQVFGPCRLVVSENSPLPFSAG